MWRELVSTYARARFVLAGLATVVSTIAGMLNGWPRGPSVAIVAGLMAAHAYRQWRRGLEVATSLFIADALVVGTTTLAMGIPSVAVLAMAFPMLAVAVLERGRRMMLLWGFNLVVLAGSLIGARLLPLPEFGAGQRAISEGVGVAFVVVATIALARVLASNLRRADQERFLAQLEVDSRERRFRAMLARSSDGIAITDENLVVLELGEQNELLTGYSSETRLGGSLLDLIVPDDEAIVIQAQHDALEHPDLSPSFRARFEHRNGEVRVMDCVVSNGLGNPDLGALLFNFHDVTTEHHARLALESANEQLEQLIQSKDRFVASVSHELRTPLTGVIGLAELLIEDDAAFDESETSEFRSLLLTQARQTAAIVEDLLVAARADIGQVSIRPESFPLRAAVETSVQHVAPTQRIEIDVGPSVVAQADPVRVQQILRNLITNAGRYGGDTVWVTASAQGGAIDLQVVDDGPGVSGVEESLIFEPYQRTAEAAQPGSIGLGLSVSRTLARLMDGDLTYRREDGRSVFELSLPTGHRTSAGQRSKS